MAAAEILQKFGCFLGTDFKLHQKDRILELDTLKVSFAGILEPSQSAHGNGAETRAVDYNALQLTWWSGVVEASTITNGISETESVRRGSFASDPGTRRISQLL
jgi:hypothetical protein